MEPRWEFDFPTASGSQSGGSAAEYGFSGRIDTLVRETIQNSMDAVRDPNAPVEVTYRLIELSGEALDAYKTRMGWGQLVEHLRSVPAERGGAGILQALDRLRQGRSIEDSSGEVQFREEPVLRLLVVEDRNTKGLEGNEDRASALEQNPYRSLVFDELYSDKFDSAAGGSFGLGKVVLWAFSEFNTVFFSSVPENPPPSHSGLRMIARASLPAHWREENEFTGKGWFGIPRETRRGLTRAHSVWGQSARQLAEDLRCPRRDDETGTSIVIVGFSEPGYGDRTLEVLAQEMSSSILESFWPAMVMGRLKAQVRIELNDQLEDEFEVDPTRAPQLKPVCDLYEQFKAGKLELVDRLQQPSDCGLRHVTLKVPERTSPDDKKHDAFELEQPVLVQLLSEAAAHDEIRDKVFRFRRQGMLVGRTIARNLSITARPYVALLPAGLAAGGGEWQRRAEEFLRDAEPPAHDKWAHDTKALKAHYSTWGLKTTLEQFENEIRLAIKELVSLPEQKGGALPEHVRKMLRFGNEGGGGQDQYLSMTQTKARTCDEGWKFSFRCKRVKDSQKPWQVSVRLFLVADGGKSENSHAIGDVVCNEAERVEIKNGDAVLHFPPEIKVATVTGITNPNKMSAAMRKAAIELKVAGRGGEDNA